MENSAGIQASLAGRYASALFDLATDQSAVSRVESDLDTLDKALDESDDLRTLTTSPQLSRAQQSAAITKVGDQLGLSGLSINFLGVLAGNRRLSALPEIIAAFGAITAAQRGEVTAQVTSAHPLSNKQLAQLHSRLTAREGREVTLKTSVDQALLGGLVVTIGSQRIDGSIRSRLNSLANAMKEG